MKKLFKLMGMVTLSLLVVTQADAGKRAKEKVDPNVAPTPTTKTTPTTPAAKPAAPDNSKDFAWCRGKEHCVDVKLAAPGKVGSLVLYSKTSTGGYQKAAGSCHASGGIERTDGSSSAKTPAGNFGVIETADQLTYNDKLVPFYNATYFHDPDLFNIKTTNRMAIHSGHVDGENSHGCVRTESVCAKAVRDASDSSGKSMRILIQY